MNCINSDSLHLFSNFVMQKSIVVRLLIEKMQVVSLGANDEANFTGLI